MYITWEMVYIKNITNGAQIMNINEATALAARLESLVRRSATFCKTRETILEEIQIIAEDLLRYADDLDREMSDYFAAEQYEDKIVAQGVQ